MDHQPQATEDRISRRTLLQAGVGTAVGLPLARAAAARQTRSAKAKSIIQIWMWGGPAHLDTFDPKPDAGNDYCGPLASPIATNVAGIRIGELLPELAKHADKYSIIRSMTHGNNGHETAAYITQTGRAPGGGQVFPGVGALVSLYRGREAGYKGLIPPYVVLTELQGRFSESGFLGPRAKPFATGGDPNQARFTVEGVVSPGMTEERQRARRDLLRRLDTLGLALPKDPQLAALRDATEQAYDLLLGSAGKVFDLATEPQAVRDQYGRNTFGQSCLMARRLVEQGVPFVTINYRGWDTHKQHFPIMRRKLPEMDKAMAALLVDLQQRGLLDSTIVWWSGEFGRTPRVQWEAPWDGGRGHYGAVFSAVVAGGGFRGGQVVGSSDARGEEVRERPVYPCDLIGTMLSLVGIDPDAPLPNPQGLPLKVVASAAEGAKTGGRLRELL